MTDPLPTCPTANTLRLIWYHASANYAVLVRRLRGVEELRAVYDRKQLAKSALQEHMAHCPLCRQRQERLTQEAAEA